jgi:hypothetical protein
MDSSSSFQCQQCKRKYKQVTNYNRHVAICTLVNSKSVQESTINAKIYSDAEELASQVPSPGQLYAVVQHLAATVQQLQAKVAHLEQLAYIRKPKHDARKLLMARTAVPKLTFCKWILTRVVARITRDTLVECVFRTPNLIDSMCKLMMKEIAAYEGWSPIYADTSKSGYFLTYEVAPFSKAISACNDETAIISDSVNVNADDTGLKEWRAMSSEAFRWMVNAVHRQILSEYHLWTEECNDNSDEFIETSMRYGSVLLGGSMDWSTLVTRFGTKLWSLMCEKQRSDSEAGSLI